MCSGTDASRNAADGMPAQLQGGVPARLQAGNMVALWNQFMRIQEESPQLVTLLDTRAPEVMLRNPT